MLNIRQLIEEVGGNMSQLLKLAIVQGAGCRRSVHRQAGAGTCGAIQGQIVT